MIQRSHFQTIIFFKYLQTSPTLNASTYFVHCRNIALTTLANYNFLQILRFFLSDHESLSQRSHVIQWITIAHSVSDLPWVTGSRTVVERPVHRTAWSDRKLVASPTAKDRVMSSGYQATGPDTTCSALKFAFTRVKWYCSRRWYGSWWTWWCWCSIRIASEGPDGVARRIINNSKR